MEAAVRAALTTPRDGWTITGRTASFMRDLITCEKSAQFATFNIVAVSEALAIVLGLRDRATLGLRPLPCGHFETNRTPSSDTGTSTSPLDTFTPLFGLKKDSPLARTHPSLHQQPRPQTSLSHLVIYRRRLRG